MISRELFLGFLAFSIFPNVVISLYAISKENPVIGFCLDNTFHGFTLSACPGGIEFLDPDFPDEIVCDLCFNKVDQIMIPSNCSLKSPTAYVSNPDSVTAWLRADQMQVQEMISKESRQLLEYRMRMVHQGARISKNFETYPKGLQMLNWSRKIFQKVVGKVLDNQVLEGAYKLVEYLYHDAFPLWQVDTASLGLIMYGLQKCHENIKPVKTDQFTCRENSYIGADVAVNSSESKLYDKDHNDPLIELMWKAFEVSQTLCYPYFSFDPKLFREFQTEMVAFFKSVPVQKRWMRDITELELEAYRMMLPGLTGNLLKAADAIIEMIMSDSSIAKIYGNRLVKPAMVEVPQYKFDIKTCRTGIIMWEKLACCLGTARKPIPSEGWCEEAQEFCKKKIPFSKYG